MISGLGACNFGADGLEDFMVGFKYVLWFYGEIHEFFFGKSAFRFLGLERTVGFDVFMPPTLYAVALCIVFIGRGTLLTSAWLFDWFSKTDATSDSASVMHSALNFFI